MTLLILAIGFSLGAWAQLLHCGRILKRLKWLFLSIFLIYITLTPGKPVFTSFDGLISYEGLYLGALRVCALVILILAVNLFIQVKQQTELSSAIVWLLKPLKYFSFPVDRLAVRIALTFKYVDELQNTLIKFKNENNTSEPINIPHSDNLGLVRKMLSRRRIVLVNFFNQAIHRSVRLIEEVTNRVETADCEPVDNPVERVPRLYQWLLPLALIVAYMSL